MKQENYPHKLIDDVSLIMNSNDSTDSIVYRLEELLFDDKYLDLDNNNAKWEEFFEAITNYFQLPEKEHNKQWIKITSLFENIKNN